MDGRVRRGAQNRGRILDALYALVGEGELQPTAEQVARRAGVGERTVFRHFEDMETLHAELSSRLRREIQPILEEPPTTGSRQDRVRGFVARRARLFESILPYHRSASVQRHHSSFLQRAHAENVRALREDMTRALAPELAGDDGTRLDALELVASIEAWDRLRSEQRLGRDRAARVMETALLALLAAL
ncbi:MAG: TetR/AcrR family transcriptional regulator [Myxococcota bacterium]